MNNTESALVPRTNTLGNDWQDIYQLGEVLAKSGYFTDARSASQAVVKVLAGRELGFAPLASMTGIHMIDGKPVIGAHLLASLIKRSGRYNFEIIRSDREACELRFVEKKGDKWESCGPPISLTFKEAVESGLAVSSDGRTLKRNWKVSADDMLFARCVSKGYRRYCADLSGGLLTYVPDELEPDQPGPPSNGAIAPPPPQLNGTHAPVEPAPAPAAPAVQLERLSPQDYQDLVAWIRQNNRKKSEVKSYCDALGVPSLEQAPAHRLRWLRDAAKEGLASEQDQHTITALLTMLKEDVKTLPALLRKEYGVGALAHLLPSQAQDLIASLRKKFSEQQPQQPVETVTANQ